MSEPPTTPLAWHHLQVQVPTSWEVIGFKKNPERGQLVLSDRHGETLQAFWQRLEEAPALPQRMLDLVRANTDGDIPETEIRRGLETVAGWKAFLPAEPAQPCVAARYLETDRMLLALLFAPHAQRDPEQVRAILASFRPNREAERVWSAFGLTFTLPAAFQIAEASILPGLQVLRFENARSEAVTIHRYGMLSLLLAEEDMATFFARRKGRSTMLRRTGTFRRDGCHDGVELAYTTRGSGKSVFATLLARTWQGRVWIWRRNDQERLYCIDHHARPKNLLAGLVERMQSA